MRRTFGDLGQASETRYCRPSGGHRNRISTTFGQGSERVCQQRIGIDSWVVSVILRDTFRKMNTVFIHKNTKYQLMIQTPEHRLEVTYV